jgi:hypothetical protein
MKLEEMIIKGRSAGSVNEYYVSQALDALGYAYSYQYEVFGGSSVRGGQIIDFLVRKPPRPIPVFVQGTYWHGTSKGANDTFKLASLNSRMKGQFAPAITIEEQECETYEAALNSVAAKL